MSEKKENVLFVIGKDLMQTAKEIMHMAVENPQNEDEENFLIKELKEEILSIFAKEKFTLAEQMEPKGIKPCKCPKCIDRFSVITYKYKNLYGETYNHNGIYGDMGLLPKKDINISCKLYFEVKDFE